MGNNKPGSQNRKRKKSALAIVCIILAALFLIWTVAGSFMFIYADTAPAESVGAESCDYLNNVMMDS